MSTASVATELPADRAAPGLLGLAERGWLPDALLRWGIRRQCAQRLQDERRGGIEAESARFQANLRLLRDSPVAVHTDAANRQHYELPAAFFQRCLGPRLKYSSGYFPQGHESLAEGEQQMLALYEQRAQLVDGQDILELGCGWGSLTLWMAERYPNAHITAVSNSHSQRRFILERCAARGLRNVQVLTQDVNQLDLPADSFDRCISIEMFEHMRNYGPLLARIGRSLRSHGELFVHIFCHRTLLYPFETDGEDNWMGRHFFTGGLMPSADTLAWFQRDLHLQQRWVLDGRHYQRTANLWLAEQDRHKAELMPVLQSAYGPAAGLWFQRWRMFWMACAELFGYAGGSEWGVAHYRFSQREAS